MALKPDKFSRHKCWTQLLALCYMYVFVISTDNLYMQQVCKLITDNQPQQLHSPSSWPNKPFYFSPSFLWRIECDQAYRRNSRQPSLFEGQLLTPQKNSDWRSARKLPLVYVRWWVFCELLDDYRWRCCLGLGVMELLSRGSHPQLFLYYLGNRSDFRWQFISLSPFFI